MTVPVVDIHRLMPERPDVPHVPGMQVVLVRIREDAVLGIMVNSLGEIPEVAQHRVQALSSMFSNEGTIADSLVKPEITQESGELLLILCPEKICHRIMALKNKEATPAASGSKKAHQA